MRVPTVRIQTANGPVTINRADFDPTIHVAFTDGAALAAPVVPQSEPPAPVSPVPAPETVTNTEPPQSEPPAPVAAQQMLVTKKGRKFIVVGADQVPVDHPGIDKDGYSSEADAWAAVVKAQAG